MFQVPHLASSDPLLNHKQENKTPAHFDLLRSIYNRNCFSGQGATHMEKVLYIASDSISVLVELPHSFARAALLLLPHSRDARQWNGESSSFA